MRYQAVVLIPSDTPSTDKITVVSRLMEPYDLAREVAPYKEHIDSEGIARLAAAFHLPSAEPEALVDRFAGYGEEAGIDDTGLYVMTTLNPCGHWDSWTLWSLQGIATPVLADSTSIEIGAVITPDGEWHGFAPGWDSPEAQKAVQQRAARDLILSFPKFVAVMLDYHR